MIRLLNKKNINNLLLIVASFVLLVFISSCNLFQQNSYKESNNLPQEVEVYKTKKQSKTKTITTVGELKSPQSTEVTSEIKGKIVYLNIPEGKEVYSGHILARIEDSTTIADIKITQAQYNNALEDFNRKKKLKELGAISQQLLDNSIEKLNTSLGELEKAKAVQNKNIIKAPFTGYLSLREVSLGTLIDPGDRIVRISQINPLQIFFTLPENYLSEINLGQKIKFSISSDKKIYEAKITTIDPYLDPQTRTAKVQGLVNNNNSKLLPGRFTNVFLETTNNTNTILIPEESLIQEGEYKRVFVVDNKKKVRLQNVEIDRWESGFVEIISGLIPGDIIITSGYQKIKEGSTVITKAYKPIQNDYLEHGHPDTNLIRTYD